MNLKQKAVTGVKWSGISTTIITVLHFITLAVLARILSPSDFGLMGMIMVVIGFMQAFADMGLSNAIIQRRIVPESHLSSFFWINVVSGVVICVCLISMREIAVIYFKESSLSNYLTIAAFIFLVTPGCQIFRTILKKELEFKILSKVDISGMFAYSLSSICLALAKFGVLSLIFGQLCRSLCSVSILFFIFRKTWLPRFHFSFREIKSYLSFSAFQMGEKAVNFLSANIDYIIIGRFLGPVALGFYTLAYQIVIFPLNKINPIITEVSFPVFSRIQEDNYRIKKGYLKTINYISVLSFPMLIGMFGVAPEFILLVYGEKWKPTIIILQILCFVGLYKSLVNPVGSILLAKGKADIGFYWNVFAVIMISIAVVIGINWGIVGVAVAILILHVPLFFIIQRIVNGLIDLKFKQYFRSIKSPIFCSGIMLAGSPVCFLCRPWASDFLVMVSR